MTKKTNKQSRRNRPESEFEKKETPSVVYFIDKSRKSGPTRRTPDGTRYVSNPYSVSKPESNILVKS